MSSSWEDGPDMEQRDPMNINEHVKVNFEEVLAEPEGARSCDCVWRGASKCFTCTLDCCYKLLTAVLGFPLAFCWGCEFACLAFCHIWYCTPCIKSCAIELTACRSILRLFYESTYGACCEACGMFFSRIVVKQGWEKTSLRRNVTIMKLHNWGIIIMVLV